VQGNAGTTPRFDLLRFGPPQRGVFLQRLSFVVLLLAALLD
jgi:hypothetical protein